MKSAMESIVVPTNIIQRTLSICKYLNNFVVHKEINRLGKPSVESVVEIFFLLQRIFLVHNSLA